VIKRIIEMIRITSVALSKSFVALVFMLLPPLQALYSAELSCSDE